MTMCWVECCQHSVLSCGLCSAHYQRWRKHGDPLGGRTSPGEALLFLMEEVFLYQGKQCLTWPYAKNDSGYGVLRFDGKMRRVCRLVCERIHGPAPTLKHETAHSCGKGHLGCCSPDHLRWATSKENEADKLLHGTINRGYRNGGAKLTENEVRRIKTLRGVMPLSEIASKFGVSKTAICRIHTGKKWGWLDGASA